MLAHPPHVDPVASFREDLADRRARFEQLPLLVDHHARQGARVSDRAGIALDLLGEQFQQRGLARAVRADDADAVAVLDAQGEGLDDRALPVSL